MTLHILKTYNTSYYLTSTLVRMDPTATHPQVESPTTPVKTEKDKINETLIQGGNQFVKPIKGVVVGSKLVPVIVMTTYIEKRRKLVIGLNTHKVNKGKKKFQNVVFSYRDLFYKTKEQNPKYF